MLETRIGLSATRELTPLAQIDLSADLTDVFVLDGDDTEDRRDVSVSLALRRSITRDWQGVVGYEYRLDMRDDQDDRQANTLFLGLERTFRVRP